MALDEEKFDECEFEESDIDENEPMMEGSDEEIGEFSEEMRECIEEEEEENDSNEPGSQEEETSLENCTVGLVERRENATHRLDTGAD